MAKTPRKNPIYNRPSKVDVPLGREAPEPVPNFDLLSDFEKEELRAKARARVDARERDRAMESFLAAEVERLEKEAHPEVYEEMKEITIDLAIYADRILLDGTHYFHGKTYTVKKSTYDSMKEIMSRTYRHYAETHRDPEQNFYESQRATTKDGASYATVSGRTGAVTRF